ncbi:hypothetical protein TNCV_2893251 [Trichonephila clavipes]|nr:hypothetical protein TNCV_2893251 [Trichonephila clavipes]
MDTWKCLVPSRYKGTLNSPRAVSRLVRLVEGKGSDRQRLRPPPGFFLKIIVVEPSQNVLSPAWCSKFTCRNCGGGDRRRVAIYRPFGEFRRAKSYCHLYGAQGQRQAYLLPMPRLISWASI